MPSAPLVTLGIPVYNEAEFIEESVTNLLKQTYPCIEIVIADNASTDNTGEICKKLTTTYSQIRYIRHPTNIGQNANFNALVNGATGKYFAWVSGHDLLDNHFVERCVATLETHPQAVLAYPRTIYMTKEGEIAGQKQRGLFDITTMSSSRRFTEVMWRVDCNYVYGMFRTSDLLATKMFRLVPAADRVLLTEIALRGTFVPADTQKYYRANRGAVPQTEIQKRHRLMRYIFPHQTYTDPQLAGNNFYAPTLAAFYEVVRSAPVSLLTRIYLRCSVWASGVIKYHLFPGADYMSAIVKALLPDSILQKIMRKIG